MTFFRNLSLGLALLVSILLTLLLIPTTHAFILSKVTSYLIKESAEFDAPKMTWDTYTIEGRLRQDDVIDIQIDHHRLKDAHLSIGFQGDLELFSKVAETPLPHIAIELDATLAKKLTAHADLLDGSLDLWMDLDDLSYHAVAKELSLESYQEQQQMPIYLDGKLALESEGLLSKVIDLDLSLQSSDMHLLEPTLILMGLKQEGPAPVVLESTLSLKGTDLHSFVDINSTLAQITLSRLEYELEKGDIELLLNIKNRIKAYEALQDLQVKAKGRNNEENLTADVELDADGYIARLDDLLYKEQLLTTDFTLHSKNRKLVDILPKHPINGNLFYSPDGAEANITSSLLNDTIAVDYNNSYLVVKADSLSLSGLLHHLRQDPLASATIALESEVDLLGPLRWEASLDTTDLLLVKELTDVLGHDDAIALHVKASNPDDDHIVIRPRVLSSMMQLERSEIIFDQNHSTIKVTGEFEDLNISYYHTPSLSLHSDVDLNDPLNVKTTVSSPYETLDMALSQKATALDGELRFALRSLDRMSPLRAFKSLNGVIDFHSHKEKHQFKAQLKDINSTMYVSTFVDMSGKFHTAEKLEGTFDLKTPYVEIETDLTSDENVTDARFDFDISRLDRFAPLDPNYRLSGSGHLAYAANEIKLDLDSNQFGPITLRQKDDAVRIDADEIPLKEIFSLTEQKAMIDGILSLHAQMTASHIGVQVDSPLIRPTKENASIRPTSFSARLALDGNMSRYDGTMDITTDHEHLMMSKLELFPGLPSLKSDFYLSSDDLRKGTPILPDILIGPTRFDGNVTYDKNVTMYLKNKALSFSEELHQKLDENASGPFSMELYSDLAYTGTHADIELLVESPYFKLDPFVTHIDLNDSILSTRLHLDTELWQKDSDIDLDMHYADPLSIDAKVKTAYETLSLKDILINTHTQAMHGSYGLLLKQTPEDAFFKHGEAWFFGELTDEPVQQATIRSDSFGGPLKVIATQQKITIDAQGLLLKKVMKFLAMDSALKSGYLDLDAEMLSEDFLELNTSTMKAEISLDATDLLLEGIDVDKDIDLLKNYQDISLFEGNFPGKGIMTSIIKAPVKIIGKKKIKKSHITQVHADSYVEDGRFYCYDCAVKTKKNRIALKGGIDLNTTDLHYFEIGLLQNNGCAFFTQDIKGSVNEPEVELSKTSLALITGTIRSVGTLVGDGVDLGTSIISEAGTLTGDIIDTTTGFIPIVKRGTGAVSKGIQSITDAPDKANKKLTHRCVPFYRGMVRHPE